MTNKVQRSVNGMPQLFVQNEKDSSYAPVYALVSAQDLDVVSIISGSAISDVINMEYWTALGIKVPAALNGTPKLALKVAETRTGAYSPLVDTSGARVEATIVTGSMSGFAFSLPDAFPWPYVVLWLESSGNDINQNANRTFTVVKKS